MLISPGMTETNILGSDKKLVQWLFTVTDKNSVRYYWSFSNISTTESTGDLVQEASGISLASGIVNATGGDNQDGTNAFEFKVTECSPITWTRPTSEYGILGPSDVSFTISNPDNTLSWSDFIGGTVWIHISIGDFTNSFRPRKTRFRIKDCKPGYQSLTFECEDYIQQFLRGSYPNTRYVKDIFPSPNAEIDDEVCVPESYGIAYVPLRSVAISNSNSITDTTISFVASVDGAYAQINDSGSGFGSFEKDRFIVISGADNAENNGTFWVFTATSSRLELHSASGIVGEAAGATAGVTINQSSRYYVLGPTTKTYKIDKVHSPKESGRKSEWQDLDWVLSSSGSSEYYAVSKHGNNPYLNEPKDAYGIPRLLLNNIVVPKATIGSLTVGTWAYGDNDSLGYSTVYVRTTGNANPDGLSDNYVSVDYTFTQSTQTDADAEDWRVVQPIIADSDSDGVADFVGTWRPGNQYLDMPVKFSSSDTETTTDPAGVILLVLTNMGVPLVDIDLSSFIVAAVTFANYTIPLKFNGAFWKKQERIQALSSLLVQCNSTLISGEKISLKVLSKTSQKEFFKKHNLTGSTYNWLASGSGTDEYYCVLAAGSADPSLPEPSMCLIANQSATRNIVGGLSAGYWAYGDNDALGYSTIYVRLSDGSDPDTKLDDYIVLPGDILKNDDQGPGTFLYNSIVTKPLDDAGYFAWQDVDEPKDYLNKKLMAIGASATTISGAILEFPFLDDSRDAQQAAKITLNRTLGKIADVSFDAKMACILLDPGDVVSPNHNDYGGSYDAIIDSISIERTETSSRVRLSCGKYSQAFSDWDDISPSVIELTSEDTINIWQPADSGPSTNQELARSSFQVWGTSFITVGVTENQGQYTSIHEAVNSLTESRHNGIFLLEGTHILTSAVLLPDKDIVIYGESQGGSIVQNSPGEHAFSLVNRTKKYRFLSFSLDSQNIGSASRMIDVWGDTDAQNTSKVTIEQMTFVLAHEDDRATMHFTGKDGYFKVFGCDISGGGSRVIESSGSESPVFFYENIIDGAAQPLWISENNLLGGQIINNTITNCKGTGITLSCLRGIASGNRITFDSSFTPAATQQGIHISSGVGSGAEVSNNNISIDNVNAVTEAFFGIRTSSGKHAVTGNNININVDTDDGGSGRVKGIWISGKDQSVVGNVIKVVNADHTEVTSGIETEGSGVSGRDIISGNNITMGNDAKDTGIWLNSGSDDSKGSDNLTFNVGISVDDDGANNDVTAKDV